MAKEEHLVILKQGVEVWNRWRSKTSWTTPDLRDVDLRNADLSGIDFSKTDLRGSDLRGANLTKANFYRAGLVEVCLGEANLTDANFSQANLYKAEIAGSIAFGTNLTRANFSDVDLTDAILSQIQFTGAVFSKAVLHSANLTDSDLSYTDFSRADLSWSDLTRAKLVYANLSGALLVQTKVIGTDFTGAIFTGACIEDWHINSGTALNEVDCQYFYSKYNFLSDQFLELFPSHGKLAAGEFTKLHQVAQDTIELIFHNGMNWRAFSHAFNESNTKVIDEYGDELFLQGYEILGEGIVRLKVRYPGQVNRNKIQELLEKSYKLELQVSKLQGEVGVYERMLLLPRQVSIQTGDNSTYNIGTVGNLNAGDVRIQGDQIGVKYESPKQDGERFNQS